jgi:hypothetical protein
MGLLDRLSELPKMEMKVEIEEALQGQSALHIYVFYCGSLWERNVRFSHTLLMRTLDVEH